MSGPGRSGGPTPGEDVDPYRWTDPAAAYDDVAGGYADTFVHELDGKPFDRELPTRYARALRRGSGIPRPVCDLGCGPGNVGAFLQGLGAEVIGLDPSRGMVAQARLHSPTLAVARGDMAALGLRGGSLAGIVSFYSLIHIPRAGVPGVLGELHRVLAADGSLLLAVHGGQGSLHATEMLQRALDLRATLYSSPELAGLVDASGFDLVELHERDPYPQEVATRRCYLWASRRA